MRNKTNKTKTRRAASSPKITPEWYMSENVRPRKFLVEFTRSANGTYNVDKAYTQRPLNQYQDVTQRVDIRDLATDLCNSNISVR